VNSKGFRSAIKLRFITPFFVLLFGYTFGVAVDVLVDYKFYFRIFVMAYFILFALYVHNLKIPFKYFLGEVVILGYLGLIYSLNNNMVVANFIFIVMALHFFYVSGISRSEFLANMLLVYLSVFFIFICYVIFSSVDLTPVVIGDRERYYFGVSNPNKTGFFIFSLLILLVMNYLNFKKAFWLVAASALPLIYFLVLTGSKTAIFSFVLFSVMLLIRKYLVRRLLLSILPAIFLIVSFAIAMSYENVLVGLVLSNRPEDYYLFLSSLNYKDYFIGGSMDGYRVDNSFLQFYFGVGLLPYFFFILFFVKASSRLQMTDAVFVVTFLVYGIFEGVLVRPEFLIVLFFYYLILVPTKKLAYKC